MQQKNGFFIALAVAATFCVGLSASQTANTTDAIIGRDGKGKHETPTLDLLIFVTLATKLFSCYIFSFNTFQLCRCFKLSGSKKPT